MVLYNPITQRRRKRPVKNTNWQFRSRSLPSKAWTDLRINYCWLRLHRRRRRLFLLAAASVIVTDGFNVQDNPVHSAVFASLLLLIQKHHRAVCFLVQRDNEIADMTLEEETRQSHSINQRWYYIADLENEDIARHLTRFTKDQLQEIFLLFALPVEEESGLIKIEYGNQRREGAGGRRRYFFHPEEMFIYGMIKLAHGHSHVNMCTSVFGGRGGGRRWSLGYKYFIHHLNNKYKNLLNVNGLKRWIPMFPEFAESIRKKVIQDRVYVQLDGGEIFLIPGSDFEPHDFNISFFLDGVFFPVSKFGQGPEPGDYIGAMRVAGSDLGQRFMYGKKGHGVNIISFMLPNGIHCFYGPVSARRNEQLVLTWSGLDDMLVDIQSTLGQDLYSGMGDKIFNGHHFRCIKTVPSGPHITLTQRVLAKNLNKLRIAIEWDYGALKSQFKSSLNRDGKKLGADSDMVIMELLACGLMKNLYNCCNGNAASGFRTFQCAPPTIEQYLHPFTDSIDNPQSVAELLNIVDDPLHNL
jgi:hypothetical protein